jgi:DUF4097 and DUF4098 domain-containing protein YvlB
MTRFRRRVALVTGAVVAAVVSGCSDVNSTKTTDTSVEHTDISEIRIEKGSGNVTVRSGAAGEVTIERTVSYHGNKPAKKHRVDGTVLVLPTGCGTECSIAYVVTAPPDVTVTGENGSGDVDVSGVGRVDVRVGSGDLKVSKASESVTAEAGSGDITIEDVTTELRLTNGSGNITGRGLGGASITATAGSGDISAELGKAASVTATTGSGNIKIVVPDGPYHVVSTVSPDDMKIGIKDTSGAPHTLTVSSKSGDASIQPA